MPSTQLSERYGSQSSIFDIKQSPHVSRSDFNFSRKTLGTYDIGSIQPIDCWFCVPGDDFDISVRYLLDTLALEVPPMTNYKLVTHAYFQKCSSIWKGWETFVTKGRSGSINLTVPNFSPSTSTNFQLTDDTSIFEGKKYSPFAPMGLSSFLGLPPVYTQGASPSSSDKQGGNYLPGVNLSGNIDSDYFTTGFSITPNISLLPFMMYQQIYRYNYAPNNLLQDNKLWFPNDLADEWRIDYSGSNIFDYANTTFENNSAHCCYFVPKSSDRDTQSPKANFIPSVSDTAINLLQLRYACYSDDYFTSAKPWLVRGDEQSLTDLSLYNISLQNFNSTFKDSTITGSATSNMYSSGNATESTGTYDAPLGVYVPASGTTTPTSVTITPSFNSSSLSNTLTSISSSGLAGSTDLSITANTLRNLIAISVWQEANALTNGNYNSMIKCHFDTFPKSPEYEPQYIGGTSDYLQFTQVIQTSESTSSSPLGSTGSLGSLNSQGSIGHFHCNDYGFIMIVAFITPEVTYNQGLEHFWSELSSDDIFYPEFANLGFQPILNKEIYMSGNTSTDNDLFGYQTRYAYLKTRQNVVRGLLSLPPSNDLMFSAYAQSRIFSSTPSLSVQFVTMSPSNLRRDFLAYPNQPAFRIQWASDVKATRPLPYQSMPSRFGF